MKNNHKIIICIPVVGENLTGFLSNLEKAQRISDFVELRVDYLKNLRWQDIGIIKKNVRKKAIFTCRKKDEGGRFNQDESARLKIIDTAINLGFDYVDVELSTLQEKHDLARNNNTKMIISYHNLQKTPSLIYLKKIINKMKHTNPAIMKIATFVRNEEDNSKLFRLMLEKNKNEERIIIGMGEKGKITRILGPVLGSYLTFASTFLGETGSGQINYEKLKNFYKIFI